MKIAIVSTCKYRLSEEEFVRPLERIARVFGKVGVIRKYEPGFDKYIISGTAMKDFSYLERLEDFRGLIDEGIPVMGICAGWQILLEMESARWEEKVLIGKKTVKFPGKREEAYFLTSRYYRPEGWEILGKAEGLAVMAKKGRKLITLFHPEVMNPWIIEEFLGDG